LPPSAGVYVCVCAFLARLIRRRYVALRRRRDEMEEQLEPAVARISADHDLARETKAALDIFGADLSVTRSRDEFSACAVASIIDINQYSVCRKKKLFLPTSQLLI
jgi:hypothetical protein